MGLADGNLFEFLCKFSDVSILVLMDGARRQEQCPDHETKHGIVSILVLMDGARRPKRIDFIAASIFVSILVLMDGARRPWPVQIQMVSPVCFNPCFDGWGSPTGKTILFLLGISVSILVLMDGARRLIVGVDLYNAAHGFQSLF